MTAKVELVTVEHPDMEPALSLQAAALVLEIGNYKQTRDVDMVLDQMVGRTTVFALDGYEQVVGTAGLRVLQRGRGLLEDVVADPRRRRQGIGRMVVERAEEAGRRQGVMELSLSSSLLAIPFYRQLEYQLIDTNGRMLRKYL